VRGKISGVIGKKDRHLPHPVNSEKGPGTDRGKKEKGVKIVPKEIISLTLLS